MSELPQMMAKTFQGFSEQQTEKIARKLGFKGPMSNLNDFLVSNPEAAGKFARLSDKAKQLVEGKSFASGGSVTSTTTTTKAPTTDDTGLVPYVKPSQEMEGTAKSAYETGSVPTGAQAQASTITEQNSQLIDPNTGKLPTTAPQVTTPNTQEQEAQNATKYNATTVADKVANISGNLEAAQGGPSENATVKGQLDQLYQDFGPDGKTTPPWAAGAMRLANEAMAARGLGTSSLAGQAIVQAAMEAATPIAMADAQTFGQFEQADLEREQQVRMAEFQTQVESLFSDQAAENAAKQFNSQSENQLKTFYSGLAQSFQLARASMQLSTDQFNANMDNARSEFNSKNALAIAQSNAAWRQRIAETNSALETAVNQANASIVAQRSNMGFEAMMLLERDEMNYLDAAYSRAHASSENYLQRQTDVLLASMSRDFQKEMSESGQWFEAASAAGSAAVKILTSDTGGKILDWVGDFF